MQLIKDMKKLLFKIGLFVTFLVIAVAQSSFVMAQHNNTEAGTLSATVDRTNISEDETLQLSIVYSSKQKSHGPNLSQLETQFDIISRNQSSRVQYVNGEVNSSIQWVNVSPAKSGTNFTGQDVFLETTVNKESVYVQEQIVLTQRLYISASVNADNLDTESLNLDNVVLEELPSSKYTKNIDGKPYYVFESHALATTKLAD